MKELLQYMAKNLVDNPDAVTVVEQTSEDGKVLELHVAEGDMVRLSAARDGLRKKSVPLLRRLPSALARRLLSKLWNKAAVGAAY